LCETTNRKDKEETNKQQISCESAQKLDSTQKNKNKNLTFFLPNKKQEKNTQKNKIN
jgi:hypothetical protein